MCGAIRFSSGGLAFGSKEGNFSFKIFKSVKGSINGSEPKVGNLVEFAKWSKDCESNFLGRDFTISGGAEKIFDALCKKCEIIIGNRPSLACFADPTNDLASIKWLAHATSFDHGEGSYFSGCEPTSTLTTFAAPANGHPFLNRPGVNDPGVLFTAKWAFHLVTDPLSFTDSVN
jgi:hypothetical protein